MPGKHKIAENYHKHQTLDKLSGVPATSMLKHLFTITSSHCSVNKHKIYDKTRKKYSICLAELHNSSLSYSQNYSQISEENTYLTINKNATIRHTVVGINHQLVYHRAHCWTLTCQMGHFESKSAKALLRQLGWSSRHNTVHHSQLGDQSAVARPAKHFITLCNVFNIKKNKTFYNRCLCPVEACLELDGHHVEI